MSDLIKNDAGIISKQGMSLLEALSHPQHARTAYGVRGAGCSPVRSHMSLSLRFS